MKKGIKTIYVVMVILLLLVGCYSEDSYPPSARGVVNAFLSALSDGNIEETLKYCDENDKAYAKLESVSDKNSVHEFAMQLVSDPEKQKQIEENEYIQALVHTFIEYMFMNFQIVDYEEKEHYASYVISISCLDEESPLFGYVIQSSVFDDYFDTNQEQLERLYEKEGEDAVMIKFINDKGKEILDEYLDRMKNRARYSNETYCITLKEEDSVWKIQNMERR